MRGTYEDRVQRATRYALHEFAERIHWPATQEDRDNLWRQCAWRAAHSGARVPVSAVYRGVEAINTGEGVVR